MNNREQLIDTFTYRVFNDPRINPSLILRGIGDVGTSEFDEARTRFLEAKVRRPDGTYIERRKVDARYEQIA